jgi:AraC family transcriptional regulator of adaptative response/methylated-DNA-[protein]-cysteine methyltransferase
MQTTIDPAILSFGPATLDGGAMKTPRDTYADDEARWRAVARRERAADGAFVFAVETTGVFCRPSCPSRPALRKNVRFFDTPREAERSGFRPCKRCTPTASDPRDDAAARMVRACRLLEAGALAGEVTRTDDLARAVGMSPFHFLRTFKKHLGVTPQAYRRRVTAERAKDAIPAARSVTAALYDAGYSSSSRFYEGAGAELGMAPRRARGGAAGEVVRYVVRASSLGRVLVAWTERGLCDVRFGASEREAAGAMRKRFPAARLERVGLSGPLPRNDASVPAWVDEVVAAVERPRDLDLPLDIEGTAFQERVWRALRRIPVGETRTYAEVAAALGDPGAARAVAGACARNRIAVAIPCHRVVAADGSVSGYRWGPERKAELLRREAEAGAEAGANAAAPTARSASRTRRAPSREPR